MKTASKFFFNCKLLILYREIIISRFLYLCFFCLFFACMVSEILTIFTTFLHLDYLYCDSNILSKNDICISENTINPDILSQKIIEETKIDDYQYDKKSIKCTHSQFKISYKETSEGCRISVINCLPEFNQTTNPTGVESFLDLKKTDCQKMWDQLLKALIEYKYEK